MIPHEASYAMKVKPESRQRNYGVYVLLRFRLLTWEEECSLNIYCIIYKYIKNIYIYIVSVKA